MRKLLTLLILLLCFLGYGQSKIDSLLVEIKNAKSDTTRVNLLNKIVSLQDDPELKYIYALKALSLARKIRWEKGIANATYLKAEALYYREDVDNAAANYVDAGNRLIKLGNMKKAIRGFVNAGSCLLVNSNYSKAFEYYFTALRLSEESESEAGKALAYEGIATVYSRESNLDKSIAYALKALAIHKKSKNITQTASIAHLLGVSYHLKKDLKNALIYYNASLKNYQEAGDSLGMATNYSHLGIIEKEKDFKKGFGFQMEANNIFQKVFPNYFNSIQNMGNLGKTYFDIYSNDSLSKISGIGKKQALVNASQLLTETLKRSRENNDYQNIVENLQSFAEVEFAKGNYKSSFSAMKEYQKLHDSLFSQENKNKLATLESAQKMTLKDKEIEVNKLIIEAKERQKWFLFAGIVFLLLLGALLFIQSRNRQKTNAKLNKLNAELREANNIKTRFFSILNHDLRGPAASVVNFLRLQEIPETIDSEKLAEYRVQTMNSAEYLLDTMEDLLLWCKGQMENFSPTPEAVYLSSVFGNLEHQFSDLKRLSIQFSNPENLVIQTDEDYLITIMRNLTSNAIKSMESDSNPKIEWKAWQENGRKFASITDNGSGASLEKFRALYDDSVVSGTRSGLGLHLIRDLAKAIGCQVKVVSEIGKGTTFTLAFA